MKPDRKNKQPFDFVLRPRTAGQHSYCWLRDELRAAIRRGAAKPGGRVPATRAIATAYGLSRGTVLAAIDDLKAEGYLYGVKGSGTFVHRELPHRFLETGAAALPHLELRASRQARVSAFAKRVRPFSHFTDLKSRAFRTNLPAVDQFPVALWAQIVSRRLQQFTARDLLSCPPGGYARLRSAVAQYLSSSRGVVCSADQVLIVSGIQEAIDLVARLLLNPRDRVLVEDPGYQVAHTALHAAGAKIIPVPIDSEGAAPRKQQFRNARLIYLTPGHQFPAGVTMPVSRRYELLAHAHEAGTYIFEDDYDSEYRYSGHPLPALQGLDDRGNVIFAGSFNKTLFPTLRLGYMVLPKNLIEVFTQTTALVNRHHSIVDQAALCEFIEDGHLARHLRQMRRLYSERLKALTHHAERHWNGLISLSPIEAGVQVIGWLQQNLNAERVASAAAANGVDVVPISRYSHTAVLPEGLQIGFAAVDEQAIERGVKALASTMQQLLSSNKRRALRLS
jgi:GntR family transcriptional regulator/MocR family aminotransferase